MSFTSETNKNGSFAFRDVFDALDEAACVFERLPLRPDGLRDYRYLAMNPAMCQMFGIDDLSGCSIRDHSPDEVEDWYDDYDQVLETGVPARILRESEPQGLTLEMFVTRLGQGSDHVLLAVIRDVTARVTADRALRESETRFRVLVTTGSYSLYKISPDWRVLNRIDERGVIQDPIGPNEDWMTGYIDPSDRADLRAAIEKAISLETVFELEHRVRREDEQLGWSHSRAVPIRDKSGQIVEWFGAAADVTERHRAEETLMQAQQMEAVSRLSRAISHDFNNLLLVAMMTAARGFALILSNGQPIMPGDAGRPLQEFGTSFTFGFPNPAMLMFGLFLLAFLVLNYSRFGRLVKAIGSNEESVRLSGISVPWYVLAVYIMSGALSAIAGILVTSRSGVGSASVGSGAELDVIAAVVIGGASLMGGRGGVINTFIGVMILGVIGNIMNLAGVPGYHQQVYLGIIIVVAVVIQHGTQLFRR